ncbi:hypothetical protein PTKIN_Ptkin13bG0253300 [Pterospermum kingtungense]
MSKQGQEQFEFPRPLVPVTPFRPILPKPPVVDPGRQKNQILQANYIGSEICSSGFTQESQPDRVVACSNSTCCTEINGGLNNLKAASVKSTCVSGNSNGQRQFSLNLADCSNVSFVDLLALANAASEGINRHHVECSSAGLLPVHVNLSAQQDIWIDGTPRTHQNVSPPQNPYDLNQPAGTADDLSYRSISDFAPITPDKATRRENKDVLEIENLNIKTRTEKRDYEQANELVAARVDVDGLQCGKELQNPVAETSLAGNPSEDNQNPDNGGGHLVDLDRTPQQKQRRRKHRPKVITEGKPRKTRKPATAKLSGSQENPSGKRKYVRKNRPNKDPSVPPGEANVENSTPKRRYVRRKGLNKESVVPTKEESEQGAAYPETFERNKKSCKRTLDFEAEGQERGDSSACKPAWNSNSSSGTDDQLKGGSQSKSIMQLCGRIEVAAEDTQTGIAYELNQSLNQKLKDYISLPEDQAPGTPLPIKNNPSCRRQNNNSQKLNNWKEKGDVQLPARSTKDSNYSTSLVMEGRQASELKTNNSTASQQTCTSVVNSYGSHYNSLYAYQMIPGMQYSKVRKRQRTGRGQNSAVSSASSSITAAEGLVTAEVYLVDSIEVNPHQFSSSGIQAKLEAGRKFSPNKLHTFNCIMASNQTECLKKKRTRGSTRARNLASLNGIAQCKRHLVSCSSQSPVDYDLREVGNSDRPHTSIEALVAEMQANLAKKKRTKKRNCLVNSACSSTSEAQMNKKLVLSNQNQFAAKLLGAPPEVMWTQMFSADALVEPFSKLDINREGSPIEYQEQNALVPYNMRYHQDNALVLYRDGIIVPFVPAKKRRPRAKVDLDEETNRVWNLLLENINSEGIDGTNEEKAKWWEEERRVFHGRADSFIARMHLVQGDRRFSPWKGSVLDSVIGVFLTQNVSDHLSSSAFMSLAARFPLKSKSKEKSYHQEGTSLVDGAEFYVLEPEDTIKWDTKTSIQPVSDQSSMTVNGCGYSEEKEVVNSKEMSGSCTAIISSVNESKCKLLNCSGSSSNSTLNRSNMETTRNGTEFFKGDEETNDVLSSQNSVVSSENSVEVSLVQTPERTGSCSESNSEGNDQTKGPMFNIMNSSTSFVQLLHMAGSARLHEAHGHQNDQSGNCDNSAPTPSANYHTNLTLNSEVREVEHIDMFKEETRSSEVSKTNDEKLVKGGNPFTEESACCQTMDQNECTMCTQVALQSSNENNQSNNNIQQDETTVAYCQKRLFKDPRNLVESPADAQNQEILSHVNMSKHSEVILDITESTAVFDNLRSSQQKMPESNFYTRDSSSNKELNQMTAGSSKSKGRKAKKEKKDVDWDILRKQAEANGKKRERTEKTMDSLDWEAVRCADVNEIAQTIKARGMNNMLAERIKEFLNRLVRDHGSIDLEWLRDVPPDKAKEYLLSVRGLGLKSVECVRLLTLHHLAFPVDTNVGRIAVRLGWVPLQPLPESLQLHLLELYPILESIQKYLWPRLCKLDQKTLYELHYQMITFGKVFCTKSKPNCNACPMRGECRHFASAFASARLALPGPEEKSIVTATDFKTSDEHHAVIFDQPILPLPQPTEQSESNWQSEANLQLQAKSGVNNCDPIIEEPASPEPVSTEVAENDIEDMFYEDPEDIPTINLNMKEFTQNLQNFMQNNMELQEADMSKALVALTAEAASIPVPKLKNVRRLRTEHQVYELPDSHPLLRELDRREPDDPCKYLLAIWTPGETANSIQLPERRCNSQEHGKLCDEKTCFSCNSIREAQSQTIRGTLLIPCRTAMRGSFPLNGTYFQVNEVFADHDSSLNPIAIPREWLWDLPRRIVYFGTSVPTIFKGLTTEEIQHCFWRGYVCVRGFDQKSRAPRPLMARLHFPASKLTKGKGKGAVEDK